jgi:hypothetical protein
MDDDIINVSLRGRQRSLADEAPCSCASRQLKPAAVIGQLLPVIRRYA